MARGIQNVSVFVIDNHPVFLEGMCAVFRGDVSMRLAGTAPTYAKALKVIRRNSPDVILMELRLPEMDGFAATRLLLAQNPRLRVIIFSTYSRPEFVQEARKAGAVGFVAKTSSVGAIVKAIKMVHRGATAFPWGRLPAMPPIIPPRPISKRERETLTLLCSGMTTKEIAASLKLSPRTVDGYKKTLMTKANARNAVALSQFAFRYGYAEA
jgi:DNA-binding NarL/FixJ family response regulator